MSASPITEQGFSIGRFRVLRILGQGTEGMVYLASDSELGRRVAIKTPTLADAADGFKAEQLLKTAKTASALSHPNIVPVFEAGMHDGHPFVVFEYVEGSPLAEMLARDGPLPMAAAIVMMSQILAGVAHIHERSLIHGDIKPANILVGCDKRARVADFGLLRHERATDVDPKSGTVRYMSPECFGDDPADCRRDVYALGLVFYEMLTGEAAVTRIESLAAITEQILNEIPPPPSAKNPRIAPEVDAVVMKALCKNPAQRYADAGEMKRELDRIRVTDSARVQVHEQVAHGTVEFLLRRMAHKSDFPALSTSVSSINRLSAQIDNASIGVLSDTIMRDFALTQKLLRVVNSAAVGVRKITRISEAIAVLGVGQLRSLATAMMLAGSNAQRTPAVAAALTDAFVAGLISRNVGRLTGLAAVEELFICGMFSPLGELLTINYLADEYSEIARRVWHDGAQPDAAARAVLGIGFEELGTAVARHWQFPPDFVNALAPLPSGELARTDDPAVRMWQCAGYARELCALARLATAAEREEALAVHHERFARVIAIDVATVRELMKKSIEVAGRYTEAAGFAISKTAMLEGMSQLCGEAQEQTAEPADVAPPVDYEKTVVVPNQSAREPGWGARIAQAWRSMF